MLITITHRKNKWSREIVTMTLDFWRCIRCSAIAMSLLYSSTVHAGWNPDQSSEVNVKKSSPFALDSTETKTSVTSPKKEPSPFALGPVLPDKSLSPFMLPLEKKDPEIRVIDKPQTAENLRKKGTNFAIEGKYEEARIALAQSLEIDPENLAALNNIGLVMRKLGRDEDAIKAYQFALELDPSYALTYKNLGVLLEANGEKQLAAESFRMYTELAPNAKDVDQLIKRAVWLENKQ